MFAFQLSDEQSLENRVPDATQKKIKKSEPLANGNSEISIISSKNWTNQVSKMNIKLLLNNSRRIVSLIE